MTEPVTCSTCGRMIGPKEPTNIIYYCDIVTDGQWCGECFDQTPCGKGEHGEGCSTLCAMFENKL